MSRRIAQHTTAERAMPMVVLVLLIVSFLPIRALKPVNWFGDLLATVAAPVSQPLRALAAWLAPAQTGPALPEEIAQLKTQLEQYKTMYERMRMRNKDLLRQMETARLLIALNPDVRTRHLTAPVIGSTSDPAGQLLEIRAGQAQGVHKNDVVVVEGVQLFGRVLRAGERTSWILPITAKTSGTIQGTIMLEDVSDGLACKLSPTGDGMLKGDVAGSSDENPPIKPGMTVRLSDSTWPASAQMLVLGTIVKVDTAPDSPLRTVIVVKPRVALDRVSEVIVRIAMPDALPQSDQSENGS